MSEPNKKILIIEDDPRLKSDNVNLFSNNNFSETASPYFEE